MSAAVRIAMWSGPRNISTAMMRSWDSRGDTFVTDEPFYAHYLTRLAVDHPGREAVIASQENDWRKVAEYLTGPIPEGKTLWYQKHMAQHFLPGMEGPWLAQLTHGFLIRDPKAVVASFAKVVAQPRVEDTGFPQLVKLWQLAREQTGKPPPVVDAADILRQPQAMLCQLCLALGVPYDPAMLQWRAGPRPTDGVWAKYWYHAVEQSTGFAPYQPRDIHLPPELHSVYEACLPYYHTLREHQLPPPH